MTYISLNHIYKTLIDKSYIQDTCVLSCIYKIQSHILNCIYKILGHMCVMCAKY